MPERKEGRGHKMPTKDGPCPVQGEDLPPRKGQGLGEKKVSQYRRRIQAEEDDPIAEGMTIDGAGRQAAEGAVEDHPLEEAQQGAGKSWQGTKGV